MLNLTPHDVTIGSTTYPRTGMVARCKASEEVVGEHEGVPVIRSMMGLVYDIPPREPGVTYLVSRIVAVAASERGDFYCPARLRRDDNGVIIGADALEQCRSRTAADQHLAESAALAAPLSTP